MAQSKTTHKKATSRKKSSSDKPILPYILIGLAITIFIIVATELHSYLKQESIPTVNTDCDFCRTATAPISSQTRFKDLNDLQLQHAKRNGIKHPFKTNADFEANIDELCDNGELVRVRDSKYYQIRRLTHSHPYLTPEAANLLQEIGMRFQAKLREHDLPKYKFVITSMLRTEENQKDLQGVNFQATHSESAHYFGTTFDIYYNQYERWGIRHEDPKLEQLLTEALQDLRKECRLLIVNEKRNKCYHITVVKCKNS